MPRLFSYTITDDTGFAPHVDKEGAYRSLATCKPRIRGAVIRGDWVMAVGGKELTRKSGKNVDGRIVWVARVIDTPNFDLYYDNPEFKSRPDNIYHSVSKA